MIRSLRGITPKIAPTAWVSEFAYVVGNVVIGEHSSVWPGVTIRGDGELITIGNNVNIQEGSVVHGDGLVIEDYVSIGHCVVVHGDRIGSGSLLGNNCTFLTESTIGKECLIASNAVRAVGRRGSGPELRHRGARFHQTTGHPGADRADANDSRAPGGTSRVVPGERVVTGNEIAASSPSPTAARRRSASQDGSLWTGHSRPGGPLPRCRARCHLRENRR